MSAYLFVHSTITDPDRFNLYRAASAESVDKFGGKLLVAGAVTGVLEGKHDGSRAVVFEFPDTTAIAAWYASPDYQRVIGLRSGTGTFNFIVVNGF